jgi:AcrR family transcriptional regulator
VSEEAARATVGRREMRDRIVEVATQLLAAQGREGVSTRSVAAAAGTQAPTIYRLFGDKAGLLAAVAEHGYASYLAAKPRLRAEPLGDAVAELRAGWDLHVEFGLANPALFSLMYGDPQPDHPSASAEAALHVLAARVHAIAASGRLLVSERLATGMIHAAAAGVVMTLLATPSDERDPALSDAMFDAVIAAIATRACEGAGDPGPVPAANTLRAQLPNLAVLSSGERHVLDEWLTRIIE